MLKRLLIRLLYIFSIILAIAISIIAFQKGDWNTISASFAVIAAIISAWIATKSFEVQEDEKRPDIEIKLDIHSLSYLPQLIITNIGKQNAKNITIKYDEKFMNKFSDKKFIEKVSSIEAGEKIHLFIGGHRQVFDNQDNQIYEFNIKFTDAGKRKYSKKLSIDFSKYNSTLIFPSDYNKAFHYMAKFFEINSNFDISTRLSKVEEAILNLTNEDKKE